MQLPSQKAWGAGLGGIIGWGISYGLATWAHVDIGDQGTAALTILLGIALAHFTPPADQDVLAHINDTIAQAGTIIGKLTPASDSTAPIPMAARALADKVPVSN